METVFNKKFVHCVWDDELEEKEGIFSDNVASLISAVELNTGCFECGKCTRSPNIEYPFRRAAGTVYRFFYYDPMVEIKRAYVQGEPIQYRLYGESKWYDLNDADKESIKENGMSWFEDDCDYRIRPAEKRYRPFKDVDELISCWDKKYIEVTSNERIIPYERILSMPSIWVRVKGAPNTAQITGFQSGLICLCGKWEELDCLFKEFEFLDGSPCGVLED